MVLVLEIFFRSSGSAFGLKIDSSLERLSKLSGAVLLLYKVLVGYEFNLTLLSYFVFISYKLSLR